MTTFAVAYRATVYVASRDPVASTVLTPAAGAAHSSECKVATITGVSGFQPYLHEVSIRRGRIDPLTKRVEKDSFELTLLDKRTGTSNAQRWVTAFLANAQGENQLLGCKVYVEESLDGGTTWAAFFVGRITTCDLVGSLLVRLTGRGFAEDLDEPIFVGRPHSSIAYAVEPLVLPIGLSGTYQTLTAAPPLTGTIGGFAQDGVDYADLNLSTASQNRLDNVVTQALYQGLGVGSILEDFATDGDRLRVGNIQRVRCRFTTGSLTDKEGWVASVRAKPDTVRNKFRVYSITLVEVDAADPYYTDLSAIATTDCSFVLYQVGREGVTPRLPAPIAALQPAVEATSDAPLVPLFLNDVHPVQLFRDICEGDFSALDADGDPLHPLPIDTASFTALTSPSGAQRPFPTSYWAITKSYKRNDFLEEYLCKPYGLTYRFVPDANGGNPVSRLVVKDIRLPVASQVASVPTIGAADIVASETPGWKQGADAAVTAVQVSTFLDDPLEDAELVRIPDRIPNVPTSRVSSREVVYQPREGVGRVVLGTRFLAIDALGLRAVQAAQVDGVLAPVWTESEARRIAEIYRTPFGTGPAYATAVCRRTSNTTGVYPGDWVLLNADVLPNTATNERGGTRLMLCVDREDDGPRLRFEFLDAGPNASAAAPTVGTLAQGDPAEHAIEVPITVNAQGDPVIVEVLNTGNGVTRYTSPGDTDGRWLFGARVTATGTVILRNLPSDQTIFVRARSEPTRYALPSSWARASTQYVDTAAYTAPSSLAIAPDTTINGTDDPVASWTVGETGLPVWVALTVTGAALPLPNDIIARLPPGSTQLALSGYLPPPVPSALLVFDLMVLHPDGLGGFAVASLAFNITDTYVGPGLAAPTITLTLARPASSTGALVVPKGSSVGIRYALSSAPVGAEVVVERDTANTFATAVEVYRGPGAVVTDVLPLNNTTYYYRAKSVQSGATDSAWSSTVSGCVTVIPAEEV